MSPKNPNLEKPWPHSTSPEEERERSENGIAKLIEDTRKRVKAGEITQEIFDQMLKDLESDSE